MICFVSPFAGQSRQRNGPGRVYQTVGREQVGQVAYVRVRILTELVGGPQGLEGAKRESRAERAEEGRVEMGIGGKTK